MSLWQNWRLNRRKESWVRRKLMLPPFHLLMWLLLLQPILTRSKGKSKVGMSVWDDPAIALGRAHNVITNDELKVLSSIPSHELVSRHIHKLVQASSSALSVSFLELCLVHAYNFPFSYLVQSGSWGIIAPHHWLSKCRGKGCSGNIKSGVRGGWMLPVEENAPGWRRT